MSHRGPDPHRRRRRVEELIAALIVGALLGAALTLAFATSYR